jgi:hypothetical protein
MSEEHLRVLEALGTLARDEQLELRDIEALCDPVRRAQTLQRSGDSPCFDKALAEATLPLSPESQARIVQRVQEALRANSLPQQPRSLQPQAMGLPANQNADEALVTVKRKRPSARAQPRRPQAKAGPKPLRIWASVALPLLAAAAGVFLWLDPVREPIALPEYNLHARSKSLRGEPAAPQNGSLVIPQGGTLELEIRPDSEYPGALELQVQLQRAGDNLDLPARIEQSAHGTLRVRIDRAGLAERGNAQLLITLARPEAVPLLAAREPDELRGQGWQAWLLEVQLP